MGKEELEKVYIGRFLEESCEWEQISGIVARDGVWVFILKIQLKRERFPREEMMDAEKGSCPLSSCKKEWEIRELRAGVGFRQEHRELIWSNRKEVGMLLGNCTLNAQSYKVTFFVQNPALLISLTSVSGNYHNTIRGRKE